jgi:hypothetical protein
MQLLDLHEEGHSASSRAARPLRAALRTDGADDLSIYYGTAQHTFCRHCGIHAFYVPRSDPDQISVNARCLDEIDVAALQPSRFFDGRNWEAAFAARQASGS